jgi:hypothetical protein
MVAPPAGARVKRRTAQAARFSVPAMKMLRLLALLIPGLLAGATPLLAADASVQAKNFPTGYFYQYHKLSIPEKEKVLGKIDATLQQLNRDKVGLIAKGAVIEKPDITVQTYPKLTILDESGLVIIARQVPNLYYQYRGQNGINPNIYIIIKNARVNVPESYIRYSYVVEGDFVAYAQKYVSAILGGLEGAPQTQPAPPPARPPR